MKDEEDLTMYADAAAIGMGSLEHREILARFFLDTHVEYDPQAMQWPTLPEAERARLAALPFWQEAIETESVTSKTVSAAAALESDPEIRKAIEMQGFEERRHARLLLALTEHYRIVVVDPPLPVETRSLEADFLSAGFGECLDSFFAFGLFALAQDSGLFNPALVKTFEPVIQEEARHILFFVNWVKYRRSQMPFLGRVAFRARCGLVILKKVANRVKTARSLGNGARKTQGNFTMNAHRELGQSITLHRLLGICLRENERRMSHYDARLRRPKLVPGLARLAYRILPATL